MDGLNKEHTILIVNKYEREAENGDSKWRGIWVGKGEQAKRGPWMAYNI